MKIDVHIHTKATKTGDAPTRQIDPARFCEIVKSTEVGICAITNHNHFDHDQYSEISEIAKDSLQVWPGVELDILEDGRHGHLLVIVNPRNVSPFGTKVKELIGETSPDKFTATIEKVALSFDLLDAIFIPHYYNKSPSISEEDIDLLASKVSNSRRILKEASNSISAGIFIGHGHKTIYGSDVKDWGEYQKISQKLPDLRLPVESFEHFCLLLERDDATIETIRNRKFHQKISIKPFREDGPFEVEIWDDINVLFGSKGTGKTDILRALAKHYSDAGHKAEVFESNQIDLSKRYDLSGSGYKLNLSELPVESCQSEFDKVRAATEKGVTSMKKYLEYFSVTETSKISKRIKLKLLQKVDGEVSKIRLRDTKELLDSIQAFKKNLGTKAVYVTAIGEELFSELLSLLARVEQRVASSVESEFLNFQVSSLFNNIIEVFHSEIARKTGTPEKPLSTGFSEYAGNRIELEIALSKIWNNISTTIEPRAEFVGDLGKKGKLFCKTVLMIQNGEIVNSDYRHVNSQTKNPEKQVARAIKEILSSVYSGDLFEKITILKNLESGDQVKSVEDLILFRRFFELDHREYKPSNGESAMILLAQELASEKEIFIIDEPEKSLGNDYISDFIVPLLKEHAYSGKRIIVATHDANIAVRTLPYNSIFREHEHDCYRTYFGNPFSNRLLCIETGSTHDWKEMSMRTLEGGREAFGERGRIYGNV
jgi:ABC-type cobalamin/Fe3+-siderophores transport system ATPase subunit